MRFVTAQTKNSYGTIWVFIRNNVRLLPSKLQNSTQHSNDDKIHRVSFFTVLRNFQLIPGFWDKFSSLINVTFPYLKCVTSRTAASMEQSGQIPHMPRSAPTVMVRLGVSSKEGLDPCLFENEILFCKTYKRLLHYVLFLCHRAYF